MANQDHLKIINQGVEAWNAWRGTDNVVIDLAGANFSNYDLSGINFGGARLHNVMFNAAKLKGANFSQSRLAGSSFSRADLSNSDFTHAALDFVIFLGANLSFVNFHKSELGYTVFAQTNLVRATGFETCLHLAPSSIDFGTLNRSGSLPKAFLLACGVSEESIGPVLLSQTLHKSCFISFSTKDDDFAQHLRLRMLKDKMPVFYAPEDLKGGRKLHEQLFDAIKMNERLLLVLSPHSIRSEWVMTEIRKARETERKENRRKLFPIRLTDFETLRDWTCFDADTGKDLAIQVREYFIPDFSDWKNKDAFEVAFARLQKNLRDE